MYGLSIPYEHGLSYWNKFFMLASLILTIWTAIMDNGNSSTAFTFNLVDQPLTLFSYNDLSYLLIRFYTDRYLKLITIGCVQDTLNQRHWPFLFLYSGVLRNPIQP